MNKGLLESLLRMPVGQRAALAGEIWDSLPDEAIPTSPALKRKLRARMAEAESAAPETYMTLAEFRGKARNLIKQIEKETAQVRMTKVHVPPEAWTDVFLAVEWYEAQGEGLGADLMREVLDTVEEIAVNPLRFRMVDNPIRRARVRRFPFGVFFRIKAGEALIIAIEDLRRSPERWKKKA